MIIEINNFTLEQSLSEPDFESAYLHYNGSPTGKILSGCAIEKQYQANSNYIIITSYGWACEECNYVTLLDSNFNTVDKKHIGIEYCSMCLKDANVIKNNEILLTFTNGASVIVRIRNKSIWTRKPAIKLIRWKYSR